MPFALFWALFALCSALFCSIPHLFFAVFRFSLSLCLPPRIAGLLLIFFARFFNFVSLCFALRAILIRLYIVFWYYLNTTHRNAIHTRNFASFRSALLRFALPRISSFFLSLPLAHFSSVQFILFCFVSLRLFFAGCCSFLRVPPCFTLLRCFVPFSFSLSLSVLTSPCSYALLCLA